MAPLSAPGTISKIIVTPSVVLGVCDGCAATRDARATDIDRVPNLDEPRRLDRLERRARETRDARDARTMTLETV